MNSFALLASASMSLAMSSAMLYVSIFDDFERCSSGSPSGPVIAALFVWFAFSVEGFVRLVAERLEGGA